MTQDTAPGASGYPDPSKRPFVAIDLPHGYQTLVEVADLPLIDGLTLYRGTNGYVYFSKWINGASRPETLHGFLVPAPKGFHTDHENGVTLDNRRSNLRVVTYTKNPIDVDQLADLPADLLAAAAYRARLRETEHRWQDGANRIARLEDGPPQCPPPRTWTPYTDLELVDHAVNMAADPWWTYQRAAPVLHSICRRSNLPAAALTQALGAFT